MIFPLIAVHVPFQILPSSLKSFHFFSHLPAWQHTCSARPVLFHFLWIRRKCAWVESRGSFSLWAYFLLLSWGIILCNIVFFFFFFMVSHICQRKMQNEKTILILFLLGGIDYFRKLQSKRWGLCVCVCVHARVRVWCFLMSKSTLGRLQN